MCRLFRERVREVRRTHEEAAPHSDGKCYWRFARGPHFAVVGTPIAKERQTHECARMTNCRACAHAVLAQGPEQEQIQCKGNQQQGARECGSEFQKGTSARET